MIQFRKVHDDAVIPTLATKHAACYDAQSYLTPGTITAYNSHNQEYQAGVSEKGTVNIHPGSRYLIPLGWAVRLPTGMSMRLYSRSGLALKRGLVVVNGVGIVDSDYRHEVFAIITNIGNVWVPVSNGSRICQVEFVVNEEFRETMREVSCTDEEWFDSERTGGFGSTGVLPSSANGVTFQ